MNKALDKARFPGLMQAGLIGRLKLRNRIVMLPMGVAYGSLSGEVTRKTIDYYGARAKGGVGLIVIGGCTIDETSGATNMLSIRDDRFVPGLATLARVLKEQGAKVAVQLFHAGRYARSQDMGGRQPVSSSPLPSRITREIPLELSLVAIKAIQKDYARAAARVKQAGFDATGLR